MFATSFQWCNAGFITVFLAYLNIVQCINFGNIFDGFSISLPFRRPATAEHCTILKNQRKCLFTSKNIELENNNFVQLIVNAGGRTIQCNKKLGIGANQWYGNCDGDANDANFIARFDMSGKKSVYGSIHVGDEICRIGPNINGEDEIMCSPRSDFKTEDDPRIVPKDDSPGKLRMLTSGSHFGFIPSEKAATLRRVSSGNVRTLYDDSGSTIDMMVVWTKVAECGNAGLLPGCTLTATTESLMRGLIDLAIAETNTAFALSGIFTALRLVHAYRDPDYVETNEFYTSLQHITTPNDGFMDSVHRKRVLYGADAIQLIATGYSCGIAWSGNPSINYMFSATHYACATGYYTFGHELGHNFGLFHDQGTEQSCNETTTFNYGYRHPNAEYRTMLSYDCKMGECDRMPKDGCPRIQRFSNSNPAYKYNGKPIGNANSDNARQFNQYRATVAAFFPAMDCQSDAECDDRNADTIDKCNTAKRVCVFAPIGAPTTPPSTPTTPRLAPPTNAPVDEPIVQQQQVGFFQRFFSSLVDRMLLWIGFGIASQPSDGSSTSK